MTIDHSFKSYKRQDLKVGYKLKLDGYNTYRDRRGISKILKFDENNQYDYAITKPLPTSHIKRQKKLPTWKEKKTQKSSNSNAGKKFIPLYLEHLCFFN